MNARRDKKTTTRVYLLLEQRYYSFMRLRPFFSSGRKKLCFACVFITVQLYQLIIIKTSTSLRDGPYINNKREAFWASSCRRGVMGIFCWHPDHCSECSDWCFESAGYWQKRLSFHAFVQGARRSTPCQRSTIAWPMTGMFFDFNKRGLVNWLMTRCEGRFLSKESYFAQNFFYGS